MAFLPRIFIFLTGSLVLLISLTALMWASAHSQTLDLQEIIIKDEIPKRMIERSINDGYYLVTATLASSGLCTTWLISTRILLPSELINTVESVISKIFP